MIEEIRGMTVRTIMGNSMKIDDKNHVESDAEENVKQKRSIAARKMTAVICSALLMFSLGGCGSKKTDETVSIDVSELAGALLETVTSDTLSETASSMIPSIYYLDEEDVASAAAFASSGATACEVAVIESTDTDSAENVETKMQTRVDNQAELYASYNQSEAARLDTAIIKSNGAYTVLCVCDDTDRAEEILEEYGF
ncbi:MAG: DUF4358 domain-containing protein [Clostridiales bacterium]|nr:DUF4358 domain-containing protein [Clostridiales bacterium]